MSVNGCNQLQIIRKKAEDFSTFFGFLSFLAKFRFEEDFTEILLQMRKKRYIIRMCM